MPTYVFKGRNKLNETVVGERVADNRDALRQLLRREQVILTSVKEKGREMGIPKLGGKRKKVKSKAFDLTFFRLPPSFGIPISRPFSFTEVRITCSRRRSCRSASRLSATRSPTTVSLSLFRPLKT